MYQLLTCYYPEIEQKILKGDGKVTERVHSNMPKQGQGVSNVEETSLYIMAQQVFSITVLP